MAEAKLKTKEVVKSELSALESYRDYSTTDIAIKPFFDPSIPNGGLEKYGQVFFEGAELAQSLRFKEINGVVRYTTGLDEYADHIKRMDTAEAAARIKAIREIVSALEYELFANKVDPNDKEFWTKVTLAPTRDDYWSKVKISVGNHGRILDPKKAEDLILIIAIENGGFDDIAGSLDEAKTRISPPKLYLEKRKDTRIQDGRVKESRDKAIYELYKTKMESPQDLFILAKNVLPISNSYKVKDRTEIIYADLNDYIEGVSVEKDKKKAPLRFLEWLGRDKEYLTIRAYVMEAIFLKHLVTKSDNKIYIYSTGSMLGGNIEECIEHLKQPMNQRDLDTIQEIIDPHWNR